LDFRENKSFEKLKPCSKVKKNPLFSPEMKPFTFIRDHQRITTIYVINKEYSKNNFLNITNKRFKKTKLAKVFFILGKYQFFLFPKRFLRTNF